MEQLAFPRVQYQIFIKSLQTRQNLQLIILLKILKTVPIHIQTKHLLVKMEKKPISEVTQTN